MHNRFPANKAHNSPSKAGINPHTGHKYPTTRPTPDTHRGQASRTPTIKGRNSRPRSRANNRSRVSSPNSSSRVRPPRRLSSPAKTISRTNRTAS